MNLFSKKILTSLVAICFISSIQSQDIDPETLKSIMDLQGSSQSKAGDREYKSFTQNNYSNTMRLLDEFDKKKEETLFYASLNEERIELVAKLCSKDPRACYLVDEYRKFKFDDLPKTIDDLEVFGVGIFAGYPLNLDSFNELPLPATYQLKVGDVFEIDINGLKIFSDEVRIDPMGAISIPGFGQSNVAGLTLSTATKRIEDLVDSAYPGSDVYVGLKQINPKKVYVLGNVLNPGGYGVNAFATVINSLIASGGFKENSSLRNIQINNQGSVKTIDLYDFLINGNTASDVVLDDGDTLLVPGVSTSVSVFGAVNRPAIYEIKKGETLANVINFSLGFSSMADESNITIKRRNVLGSLSSIAIENKSFEDFQVQNGDQILVNALSGSNTNNIDVIGAVRNPGQFQYSKGATVSNFINLETDLLDATYTPIALIKRFDPRTRGWRFIKFDLLDQNNLNLEPLSPRDKIFIFSRQEIAFLSSNSLKIAVLGFEKEVIDSNMPSLNGRSSLPESAISIAQPSNDELIYNAVADQVCFKYLNPENQSEDSLPTKLKALNLAQSSQPEMCPGIYNAFPELMPYLLIQSVPVLGNTRLPGLYPVSQKVSAADLISYSGGILKGDVRKIEFEVASENSILNFQYSDLQKQSNIRFINIKSPSKDLIYGYISLHGEFVNPGTYSISRGETLSSVYKRAGGFSSLAYPVGGILTRESTRKKEQRVLEKAKKDIAAVLTNAAVSGSFNQSTTDLVQLIQFISNMSDGEALGRIVTEMDTYKLRKDPSLDINLEPGDNIYLPPLTNTITVVGSVLNPITVPYKAGQKASGYIDQAGGFSQTADKKRSYVIYPNGTSKRLGGAFFGLAASNALPGSTIIVPRKAAALDGMTFLKNITPILADLSITAASINAISSD